MRTLVVSEPASARDPRNLEVETFDPGSLPFSLRSVFFPCVCPRRRASETVRWSSLKVKEVTRAPARFAGVATRGEIGSGGGGAPRGGENAPKVREGDCESDWCQRSATYEKKCRTNRSVRIVIFSVRFSILVTKSDCYFLRTLINLDWKGYLSQNSYNYILFLKSNSRKLQAQKL